MNEEDYRVGDVFIQVSQRERYGIRIIIITNITNKRYLYMNTDLHSNFKEVQSTLKKFSWKDKLRMYVKITDLKGVFFAGLGIGPNGKTAI